MSNPKLKTLALLILHFQNLLFIFERLKIIQFLSFSIQLTLNIILNICLLPINSVWTTYVSSSVDISVTDVNNIRKYELQCRMVETDGSEVWSLFLLSSSSFPPSLHSYLTGEWSQAKLINDNLEILGCQNIFTFRENLNQSLESSCYGILSLKTPPMD